MADNKFVDLIFEPNARNLSVYKLKLAYQSLAKSPQQLFALFTDKYLSTTFFSAFEIYGKQLAVLLDDFPKYFGPTSEHQLPFGKDPFGLRLLEEALGAFLFSLFANDFLDAATQQSMVGIAMAFINLSKPGGALGLLGAKLGDFPLILGRLIGHGHFSELSRNRSELFSSLTSNDTTLGAWAQIVANRAGQCSLHSETSQDIRDWKRMQEFLQSFPCKECPAIMDASEPPLPRQRNVNPHGMNSGIRAFDSLLGQHLGPWKVVISGRALRDLKEAVHSGNSDHIRQSLLAIASGEWVRKSLRRSVGNESGYRVPVYKVACKGNVIIWQVDVAFDERHDHNMQVVKVWSICAYAEVEDICGWVIQAQQAYTEARVAACQTIDLQKKATKGTIYPEAVITPGFPEDSCDEKLAGVFGTNPEIPLTAADQAITEGSPILGKFYSLTTTVLENIHPEAAAAIFPIDPSKEEFYIINHFKSPAFILGRSGTGKTTCLIYKLASRYLSSKNSDEAPVRQVCISHSLPDGSDANKYAESKLLLTRSKDLAQKLNLYTKRLINTRLGIIAGDRHGEDDRGFAKELEEDTTRDLLSLNDEDFPIVCTFNHFLRLLENLVRTYDIRKARQKGALKKASKPVNFTTFSLEYWQHLPTALTCRIPVDLAFIDIMGVIKGSASLASNLEPLSRDSYTARRWKLAPNFTTDSDRKAVYTLYEHYERIKMGRREVDDTDRVIRVLKSLKKDPELHRTVETFLDEVYVDEVQDQRPLEIELLLTLIRDPWGIHFAGDTAQSISKDSLFRFANAKALFYTRFNDLSSTTRKQSWLIPELLPLSHNYRSHKGILAVASVFMDLLYTAFPALVDKLPPEIGDQIGPIPTLFVGSDLVSALHSSVGRDAKGNPTDKDQERTAFGGLRVILVRDEKTQFELQRKVSTFTLVLTILQSKGMEFDDVFLYNFFSTSPYSSSFKVLGDLLRERHSSEAGEHTRYANWEKVDSILCSELKHLYVAVTRAQNRLWIVESKEDVALPVINLFNKIVPTLFPERYPNSLLNVIREFEFENVSELRKLFHSTDQTTPTKWKELAYELIAKNAYTQAALCFENANDKAGEALANAYIAELRGMKHRAHGLRKEFIAASKEACKLFLKAGRISKAVECQEAIGDTVAAAELLSDNGRHEEAAWLFTKTGEPKKAAREYAELGKHEKVLATCYHAGLYSELAVYLKSFAHKIDPNCRKQYSRLCYLLLIQERLTPKLQATIALGLGSKSEQEGVFREFGMMNHVFHLYETDKRFKDAYEVAANIGFLEEAIQLASDHGLLTFDSYPVLTKIFDYIQAGHLLAQTTQKLPTRRPNSKAILSLDRGWKSLIEPLFKYRKHGGNPNRISLEEGVLRDFFDLVVTMQTPGVGAVTPDLTRLPLESIGRAIGILKKITVEKTPPYSALLYLGIFEIPTQPGNYIALPRSTGIEPKLGFPIQHLNINTVCDMGGQLVLNTVSTTLDFIAEIFRKQWKTQTTNDIFQGRSCDGKWTGSQFSANLRALISMNLLFSNIETIPSPTPIPTESVMADHKKFWQQALIRQMTFVSSYEQDATILVKAKYELGSTTADFKKLYGRIKHHFLCRLQSRTRPQELFGLLSYLLQQMQIAVFFDIETRAMEFVVNNRFKQHELPHRLKPAVKLVTLAQAVRINTTSGDFPGYFCENIHKLLSKFRQIHSRSHQLFYSAPVLSLYEELITLLILLTRPIYFVIPQSWAALHLTKFAQVPRSTSKREILWYQRMLVAVVVNFCELVRRIEATRSSKLVKANTLVRRSLYILVVSIINADITYPCGYREMWNQVQEVLKYQSLIAWPFLNCSVKQLLQNLVKDFAFYDGKDKLSVIVTDNHNLPVEFAGLSLKSLGIVAAYSGIPQPQKRPLESANTSLNIKEINAAYIITQLWRTDGAQFVQRMQCKRAQYAYERLNQRQKPKACQNCCILVEMRCSKNFTY